VASLRRIVVVAANTYRETVRERVLYNLVFFAVLMTLSGLLLRQLSVRQDEKLIKDIGLAAMELFGTAIALFIGVGLVGKEIERRSLFPLLAKPLTRSELLLGKFAGLGFTLLVNTVTMAAGLYLTLVLTGREADPALLKAIAGIYLNLLVVIAIAITFSTLTSSMLAAVCSLAVVVTGHFSDIIRSIRDLVPDFPVWLSRLLYYAVPNFHNFDFKAHVVYGDPVAWSDLGWSAVYAMVYLIVLLSLSVTVFRSRDFQ
jgi:ABC-type transport system involved in multi-copper enzyme maturation permease subunit